MVQPNWLFIVFGHHDDGLNSLQGKDNISAFNLEETCKINDRYRFLNGDDGFEDSSEVGTMCNGSKHLVIKRVKPRMTLQSSLKFSVGEVTSVVHKIGECEGKYERPCRLFN